MLLSLFCGAGGLDLGFESEGFDVGLAYDRNVDSVKSYNLNRENKVGLVDDVTELRLQTLDRDFGTKFAPSGVIGGPPCQSFSQANVKQYAEDPRHQMPLAFAKLVAQLNKRTTLDFVVMENVVGLTLKKHRPMLQKTMTILNQAGFDLHYAVLNALSYGTPQSRDRLFVVGFSRSKFPGLKWKPPEPVCKAIKTVRDAIGFLPEPVLFERGLDIENFEVHPNHWSMKPKSPKFHQPGMLSADNNVGRSFRVLSWDRPSPAVAYGHREVHVHPNGHRRLSVYEAMLLQGFPKNYRLFGNLSSQIRQVSEAVPYPLASAVARSIVDQINSYNIVQMHRSNRQIFEPSLPALDVVIG